MEYRTLGNTGLLVSVLGFGTMTFDTEKQAIELLEATRKHGCNFYDNAELYGEPLGNSEIVFGKALKHLQAKDPILWRRSDLVITTKIFWGPNPTLKKNTPFIMDQYGKNEKGVSRLTLAPSFFCQWCPTVQRRGTDDVRCTPWTVLCISPFFAGVLTCHTRVPSMRPVFIICAPYSTVQGN